MSKVRISQKINVPFSYEVAFTENAFSEANSTVCDILADGSSSSARILFFVEKELLEHHPELSSSIVSYCKTFPGKIELVADPVILEGGEKLKSFSSVSEICTIIAENGLCRHSFAAIIGGGAFLDAVGFAASIVHRGVRQLRFPTTVLSQNDSGVGVKNGLNMFGKKNFLGCFAPPFAVINDFDFIKTLRRRDWISGIAEAFKVAIIKDSAFFNWLCENTEALADRNMPAMEELIKRCAELHLQHIRESGDPFEMGSARPLDFGHWTAHKLEMMSGDKLRHGEAVALGILVDSIYANEKGLFEDENLEKLVTSFKKLGFNTWDERLTDTKALLDGLQEFREHLGGDLHITLPDGLGRKVEVNEMDSDLIEKSIEKLRELAG